MQAELYIGLMSGTSLDGIDAVLIDFADNSSRHPQLLANLNQPFPADLRQDIFTLCKPGLNEIERLGQLDCKIGKLSALAVKNLLAQTNFSTGDIQAIGSHGQTIRHQPYAGEPFTLQIGDPNIIAEQTGITTVADFRRRDIACGGQGAPLTPAFHNFLFHTTQSNTAVVNIGGIANITFLPADLTVEITGFDTGPGNILSDLWVNQHCYYPYDDKGKWAATGKIQENLLQNFLNDKYFSLLPPKSTGREYFNETWLRKKLIPFSSSNKLINEDVQATLVELTARSISQSLHSHELHFDRLLICGGGVHNDFLIKRIQVNCAPCLVQSTAIAGIDPDWLEAIAFAWLARQTLKGNPSNLPSVTGASHFSLLGAIYPTNR